MSFFCSTESENVNILTNIKVQQISGIISTGERNGFIF